MENQRKILTNKELIAVTRYLDHHRESLEGLPPGPIIDAIRHGTGVSVTHNNLKGFREVEGLEWVFPKRRQAHPQSPVTNREIVMADSLVGLFRRLGEEPPEELMDILRGQAPRGDESPQLPFT